MGKWGWKKCKEFSGMYFLKILHTHTKNNINDSGASRNKKKFDINGYQVTKCSQMIFFWVKGFQKILLNFLMIFFCCIQEITTTTKKLFSMTKIYLAGFLSVPFFPFSQLFSFPTFSPFFYWMWFAPVCSCAQDSIWWTKIFSFSNEKRKRK